MTPADLHLWARSQWLPRRAGLLSPDEAERVADHLRDCEACRAWEATAAAPVSPVDEHLPASLLAEWPRARGSLEGLERALVRRHLERCAECRQDLELLGHEPVLAWFAEREYAGTSPQAAARAASDWPTPMPSGSFGTIRVVRELGSGWRDRALAVWASLATVAAAIAIVMVVRRPVVEGFPSPLLFSLSPPAAGPREPHGAPSVRLAPRPRSLSGPVRGGGSGKVTVIPVIGPVPSLALAVRPLDVPDTSWVQVSLVRGDGDTLLTVRHRQWEFFPRRMLVIDGGDAPLEPGRYALVLTSRMADEESPTLRISRYLFELRPRPR